MEVSLRGSYGVQLQPVIRATLSAPLRYYGLARQRRAHCPSDRDYFHASLWPDSGHADLLSNIAYLQCASL